MQDADPAINDDHIFAEAVIIVRVVALSFASGFASDFALMIRGCLSVA